MPDAIPSIIDKRIDQFSGELIAVMRRLEKGLQNVIAGAATNDDAFNAQVLIGSQQAFISELRSAGYYDLAAEYIATFNSLPDDVAGMFKKFNLPDPAFTTVDKELFRQLAENDFERFVHIGESAMTELRQGLVSQAIAAQPFSDFVESVRAATVGMDGKGSPLANHAYTHANTAILEFNGQAVQRAGESIGFDSPDDKWQVVGVLDGKTREICSNALANPVRTRQEWEDAGYWGGAPGGWNCRHTLVPYVR